MGNSLRCCLACVIPCGALDLIRIVHLNGCVEELTGRVTAAEVLRNNPNHVLTKPCSQGMTRRILILSSDSELKRGSIYFLLPASSLPADKNNKILKKLSKKKSTGIPARKLPDIAIGKLPGIHAGKLPEIIVGKSPKITTRKLPEKKSACRWRDRSRSRGGAWIPNLESISED